MAEEDQQDEAQKEDVSADGDEENAEGQDGESEGEGEDDGKGGKKKILLIVGLVLILALGGGAGAYFLGYLDGLLGLKSDAPMHCVVDTHGEETCEPVHCEVDDHGEDHCDPAMRCEIVLPSCSTNPMSQWSVCAVMWKLWVSGESSFDPRIG